MSSSYIDVDGNRMVDPLQTLQSNATAIGNGISLLVRGMEGILIHVTGITSATITIVGTDPNGNTINLTVKDVTTGISASTITTNGFYYVEFVGLSTIQAQITSYTSGTITITAASARVTINSGNTSTTVSDGSNTVEGATTDTAVQGDNTGTLSAKLRGLIKTINTTLNAGQVTQVAATLPASTTMQNSASANGNGTVLTVTGYATAIINIISSTPMSGGTNVVFEASTDNFVSDIQPILAHQIGQQGNQVLTTSSDGDYRINCSGFNQIRARIAGYSAGATTIKGFVSPLVGITTTVGISGSNDTAQTDSTQTTSIGSFIKGFVKIFADVWDSVNHLLHVQEQFAPGYEDNVNNVAASIQKFVITSTYSPSLSTTAVTASTAVNAKNAAGLLLAVDVTNINAAVRYLTIHNKSSAPATNDVPVQAYPIPAGTSTAPGRLTLPNGFFTQNGLYLSSGVSYGISTSSSSYQAATASDHVANVLYF